MLRLSQPALAVHSCDVPGYRYQMQLNLNLAQGVTTADVAALIEQQKDSLDSKFLKNVVLNCHGDRGYLYLGGENGDGTGVADVSNFARLKNCIGRLWLVGCKVSGGTGLDDTSKGTIFCQALAKTIRCSVVAGDRDQKVNRFMAALHPKNCIDRMEGWIHLFSPDGSYKRFHPAFEKL